MSKTKQGGSSRLGRDSMSQRLGIKATAGEAVKIGDILVRQRGSKFVCGRNVKKGSDDTLYSMVNGVVSFAPKAKRHFDGSNKEVRMVSVEADKTK